MAVSVSRLTQESKSILWRGCVFESQVVVVFVCFLSLHFAFTFSFFVLSL